MERLCVLCVLCRMHLGEERRVGLEVGIVLRAHALQQRQRTRLPHELVPAEAVAEVDRAPGPRIEISDCDALSSTKHESRLCEPSRRLLFMVKMHRMLLERSFSYRRRGF